MSIKFESETKKLIDELKNVCNNAGLGNDGNEYKVITQAFLYKFLNDKFFHDVRQIKKYTSSDDIPKILKTFTSDEYEMLLLELNENTAKLYPHQFLNNLFQKQNDNNFAQIFDDALIEISSNNNEIFSIVTSGGQKIKILESISQHVSDNKDSFCRAIVNKLINFSFENVFDKGFDFFSIIFEYLIQDYNSNSGSTYAEYFTPFSISKIISKCLIKRKQSNVVCYDPSAGSGTLLMCLGNELGEKNCTIFSQDISQKSSHLLRLNLILNNLVHSIPNIIQGNTILEPYHKEKNALKKFDYIISNPPFNTDFSDYRNDLDTKENKERFFAGIPKIPKKKKQQMPIYTMFLQHILYSLKKNGRAAVVVPEGFISAKSGIENIILKHLVEQKKISGVISLPGKVFANTPTNVSIIFIENDKKNDKVVLIDAADVGSIIKDQNKERLILTEEDQLRITKAFIEEKTVGEFCTTTNYDEIKTRGYSLNPGQYFEIKYDYDDINSEDLNKTIENFVQETSALKKKSNQIEKDINSSLKKIKIK